MRIKIIAAVVSVAVFALLAWGQGVQKTARVHGRITTLWGAPLEQARLSFYKLEGISGFSPTEELVRQVAADKDGAYETVLPSGQYRVEIRGKGSEHTEVWRYYLGENDDALLDIGVPLGNWHFITRMKVVGVVRRSDGRPLPDATVTMIPAYSYNEPQSFVSFQMRTDAQGRYNFFSYEIGDYVVYVAKPGFLPGSAAFRLNNGEKKMFDIELKPAPKFELFPKKR